MKQSRWIVIMWLAVSSAISAQSPTLLVVVGTPGNKDYEEPFAQQAEQWKTATEAQFDVHVLKDKASLKQALSNATSDLWIVLIGHGSDDGKNARFNLKGPDLSPDELNEWLTPITNQTVVINCTAASGPFLSTLSAPGRTVVTATRSGMESSFSHFSEHATQAFAAREAADLDKDHALSVLEVFLFASRRVKEFYQRDERIQTENALIDDNGDGKGMQADWFSGSRPDPKRVKGGAADGYRAMQQVLIAAAQGEHLSPDEIIARDQLEQQLFALRDERETLGDDAYFKKLEPLLLKLGKFVAR